MKNIRHDTLLFDLRVISCTEITFSVASAFSAIAVESRRSGWCRNVLYIAAHCDGHAGVFNRTTT